MQEELKSELSRAKRTTEAAEGAITPGEETKMNVSMVPFIEVMIKIKAQVKSLTIKNKETAAV